MQTLTTLASDLKECQQVCISLANRVVGQSELISRTAGKLPDQIRAMVLSGAFPASQLMALTKELTGACLTIYLSGPMDGCTDLQRVGWRRLLKGSHPGVHWLDPTTRDPKPVGPAAIVEADKNDIDRSDVVIVNPWKPTSGTAMEVLYAWERDIPVWTIDPYPDYLSPWIVHHSDRVFSSLSDVSDAIREELIRRALS